MCLCTTEPMSFRTFPCCIPRAGAQNVSEYLPALKVEMLHFCTLDTATLQCLQLQLWTLPLWDLKTKTAC